jgi:hypothetical protein
VLQSVYSDLYLEWAELRDLYRSRRREWVQRFSENRMDVVHNLISPLKETPPHFTGVGGLAVLLASGLSPDRRLRTAGLPGVRALAYALPFVPGHIGALSARQGAFVLPLRQP